MLNFQRLFYRYTQDDGRVVKLVKISPSMKLEMVNDLNKMQSVKVDTEVKIDKVMGMPIQVSDEVPSDEIWLISQIKRQ